MKYLSFLFALSITMPTFASDRETFFSLDGATQGGFGGARLVTGYINGANTLMAGGYGAWLINERFYLGGGGMSTINKVAGTNYLYNQGGIIIGTFIQPNNKLHFATDLMLGVGTLNDAGTTYYMYVLEPSVSVAFNINDFMKITTGISYRFVNGLDPASGLSNSNLSGQNYYMNFIFGKFD